MTGEQRQLWVIIGYDQAFEKTLHKCSFPSSGYWADFLNGDYYPDSEVFETKLEALEWGKEILKSMLRTIKAEIKHEKEQL